MDLIRSLAVKLAAMYGRKASVKPDQDKDREYIRRLLYSSKHTNRQTPWEYGRKLKTRRPGPTPEPTSELRGASGPVDDTGPQDPAGG